MIRRQTRVSNAGTAPVGIEFLTSAMLHGSADPQNYDRELRIHLAVIRWMAEGQRHTLVRRKWGFVENERKLVASAGRQRRQLIHGTIFAYDDGGESEAGCHTVLADRTQRVVVLENL